MRFLSVSRRTGPTRWEARIFRCFGRQRELAGTVTGPSERYVNAVVDALLCAARDDLAELARGLAKVPYLTLVPQCAPEDRQA